MFADIEKRMLDRMAYLEEKNAEDRAGKKPRLERLRQIPPETGKFLAIMAAKCSTEGEFIEIGTSGAYSTMWLSLAAKELGVKIKTFEILPAKAAIAKETIKLAGIEDYVELVEGDFLQHAESLGDISFCFLDAEKDVYYNCFKAIASKVVKGGLVVADNAINQHDAIKSMIDLVESDRRFDSLIVPIGSGEFVCRRNY